MKLFYPDINAFQFIRRDWSPSEFSERCQSAGCKLALGTHVMYELFRSVNKGNPEVAQESFQFLSEVKDSVEPIPVVSDLIRAEFGYAREGVRTVTVVDPLNQTSYWQEVERGALGYFEEAQRFVSQRESKDESWIAAHNRKAIREIIPPEQLKKIKTFEEFHKQLLPFLGPELLRDLATRQKVEFEHSHNRILGKYDSFPAINTEINAQLYLLFVAGIHGDVPSADRFDDFRHLVESAHCDCFVTDEKKLLNRSQDIRPFKPTISWDQFHSSLEKGEWPLVETATTAFP